LETKFSLVQNHIVRGSTTRRNIAYRTQVVAPGADRVLVLTQLYHQLCSQLVPGEKIIVFCPYKSQCEVVGQALQMPCYYSDKDEKEAILKRF
jgi:superfamily II DNA helicase RecQ